MATKCLDIFVSLLSLLWSLVWVSWVLVFILFRFCAIDVKKPEGSLDALQLFYTQYLAGNDCKYDDETTEVKRNFIDCLNDDYIDITKYPGNGFTSPEKTEIVYYFFFCLGISLIFLAVSVFTLINGIPGTRSGLVWKNWTVVVLLYSLVMTIIFGLDLSPSIELKDCKNGDRDKFINNMISASMISIVFSMGGIGWILLFTFWIIMTFCVSTPLPSSKRSGRNDAPQRNRAMSEDPDFSKQMERRFEEADEIEARDSIRMDPMGPSSLGHGSPPSYHSSYDNRGFVKDDRTSLSHKPSLKRHQIRKYPRSPPRQFGGDSGEWRYVRSVSETETEPEILPPVPDIDYPPIPKANTIADSSDDVTSDYVRNKPKFLRTKSGRGVGAAEYLSSGRSSHG